MKGNIFSPEDKEFMEIVQLDLQRYLQRNIFPSRTVLVFPPFNGFRRFLIHKLIEDNFASSEVAAFSIGQDISRRIVICYKGLVSEAAGKGLPATIPQLPKPNMIDKEKPNRQRQTPAVPVYRPPAARLAESRKSTDSTKPTDTKQTRVRRPDQQMYVPRPKRASYGNDPPRNRSRSNSRLSLDSDQSSDVKKNSSVSGDESVAAEHNGTSSCNYELALPLPNAAEVKINQTENSSLLSSKTAQLSKEESVIPERNHLETNFILKPEAESLTTSLITDEIFKPESEEVKEVEESESIKIVPNDCAKSTEIQNTHGSEMQVDSQDNDRIVNTKPEEENKKTEKIIHSSPQPKNNIDFIKENCSRKEEPSTNVMETISLSSDSRSDDSSSSFMSSSDSKTSDSSFDFELVKNCKEKRSERMDVDHSEAKHKAPHKEGKKIKKIQSSVTKVSEVLVISDSSSCDDSMKSAEDESKNSSNIEKLKNPPHPKMPSVRTESSLKQSKTIDPSECDWESLYDDSGECLVPSLMEELTNSVGKVKVTSADSDYRPYQSIEERTNDGECVIEIYDFPAEFKTTDLFNVFAAYRNKNFQIKWVDDTHALGIFPSPLMADEVLACTLPFVKTRPLRFGIVESRNKARNLVLPPLPAMERPKTCPALARRLVTGALGLRIPTSSQEREKEKQVLKEAREKRRLEAKQREAAWDGTITSGSVI